MYSFLRRPVFVYSSHFCRLFQALLYLKTAEPVVRHNMTTPERHDGEETTAIDLELLLMEMQQVLRGYDIELTCYREQILRWERMLCLFTEGHSWEADNLRELLEEDTEENNPSKKDFK